MKEFMQPVGFFLINPTEDESVRCNTCDCLIERGNEKVYLVTDRRTKLNGAPLLFPRCEKCFIEGIVEESINEVS